jgi:hypothetical protein
MELIHTCYRVTDVDRLELMHNVGVKGGARICFVRDPDGWRTGANLALAA